jgi:hypothetical protein
MADAARHVPTTHRPKNGNQTVFKHRSKSVSIRQIRVVGVPHIGQNENACLSKCKKKLANAWKWSSAACNL